jgi:hypothetical protein
MKPNRGQFQVEGMNAMPSPIGMGALADPEDFVDARKREIAKTREEEAFDKGGMTAVNKLRGKAN